MRMVESDVWTAKALALWQRIENHPFEVPACGTDLTRRLAREQRWSLTHARRALQEYRRYVFLACVAGREMTPSVDVDEVWHLHLTYTEDYWTRWCPQVLACTLHHQPSAGEPGDPARLRAQYADTLAEYERWFGPPPADFWPGTVAQFREVAQVRRYNPARHWLLPKPRWPQTSRLAAGLWALAAGATAPYAWSLPANPLDWTGEAFLQLYLALALIAFIGTLWLRRKLRDLGSGNSAALSIHELAYLAGGAERATDAAVTDLLQRGIIEWDSSSDMLRIKGRISDLDPPLDTLGKTIAADGKPTKLLGRAALIMEPVRRSLERRGLWLNQAQTSSVRWIGALPLYGVLALGIAKMAVGISRGKPVGFLILISLVLGITTLVFWVKQPGRTRAGDLAFQQARTRHARAARAPKGNELALAVAIAGTTVLAGTAYAQYHETRHPPSSSDGSSSGSDSSSDGGGDSGGGGCGGCGGGGD